MVKQKTRQIIICSMMVIFTLLLTGCVGVIIQATPTPTSAAAESMQPESSTPAPTEAAVEEAVNEESPAEDANAQATADAETMALAVSDQATAQASSATAQAADMQATAQAASFNATALAVSNQATAEAAGADATALAVSAQATANAGSANATALAVSNQATAQAVAAQATAQVVAAQATTQASGPTIRIDRPSVNVRSGPGTTYDVVTGANANEQFNVVGRNDAGDWYEITLANGTRAWIFSGIVQPSGDFSNVAVAAAAPPTAAPVPPTVVPVAAAPVAVAPTAPPAPAPVQPTAVQPAPVVAPTVAPVVAPTVAPVAPAPAAVASTAGLRGRLLYSVANMDANRWELWEFVLDNGTSKKVADWRTEIDVSRDGSQIVYFAWPSDAGEEAGTWIMDRNYSNNRLVVPGGAYASFSPGGDRLVLNGGPDIYVIRTDATGVRKLTRGEYPSWSPVNDQIVHRACVGGDCGLWIIDANSSDPNAKSRLTTGGSDGQPAWSPNGQRIAYISQDDGNFEIYAINADGTGKTRLTNDAASDGLPEWSPDGQWIAFRSDRGGTWAIYAMRADGSDLRKIVDADVLPRWFFEKMSWF